MHQDQHGNLSEWATDSYIRNTFRHVLDQLASKQGRVLTVGAGDGSFERLLKQHNPSLHITAIECNESFREQLEQTCDTVIITDFLTYKLTYTYDYIICLDVIEHVFDTDTFFDQLKHAAAPETLVYIQTPNLASWHGRLSLLFGFMPPAMEVSDIKCYFGKWGIFRYEDSIHHVRIFTVGALREMCRFYGFKPVRTVGIDHYLSRLFTYLPGIAGSVCVTLQKEA